MNPIQIPSEEGKQVNVLGIPMVTPLPIPYSPFFSVRVRTQLPIKPIAASASGKRAGPDRKDMLHPRGDREGGVDSSDAGIAHEADGVVEKDFIAADETEQWRKSGEIGEDGRGERLSGISTVQIGAGHLEQTGAGAFRYRPRRGWSCSRRCR